MMEEESITPSRILILQHSLEYEMSAELNDIMSKTAYQIARQMTPDQLLRISACLQLPLDKNGKLILSEARKKVVIFLILYPGFRSVETEKVCQLIEIYYQNSQSQPLLPNGSLPNILH